MKLKKIFGCSDPLWFDSPYYHCLYKDRDENEAKEFVNQLVHFLKPAPHAKILDLACGRGRHAVYMHKLGFKVCGVDFSKSNIEHAKKLEQKGLSFFEHDMREVFKEDEFHFIFNLFTSFGYFDEESENIKVLQSAWKSLKPKGILIIDFFNSEKVLKELIADETKSVSGLLFSIQRRVKNHFLIKEIKFSDCGKKFAFSEKVKILLRSDFEMYFSQSGFKLVNVFGDYSMNPFDVKTSSRIILVAEKIG